MPVKNIQVDGQMDGPAKIPPASDSSLPRRQSSVRCSSHQLESTMMEAPSLRDQTHLDSLICKICDRGGKCVHNGSVILGE
ncbi:hypothetical protein PMAYCL1PPCAC_09046 [Pristionchus mayeri]|uniref:Uncharacterized protein n=1 Tax=Pristionchus mayeri TaxID=1317129 RepID=A0AAN4ZDM2_9BILA|nr:hypothetical protein PMAYCL1PPCAC_09046 [Pristionchus mayeri]